MYNKQSLNLNWKFKAEFKPEFITREEFEDFESVHVPHRVKEISYDCYDDKLCCFLSTYYRSFQLSECGGKRIVVEEEAKHMKKRAFIFDLDAVHCFHFFQSLHFVPPCLIACIYSMSFR